MTQIFLFYHCRFEKYKKGVKTNYTARFEANLFPVEHELIENSQPSRPWRLDKFRVDKNEFSTRPFSLGWNGYVGVKYAVPERSGDRTIISR
jgi:hypothetical protein